MAVILEPFEIRSEKYVEPPKPQPLPHGKWVLTETGSAWCPRCQFKAMDDIFSAAPLISNFCPDCGLQLMFGEKPTLGHTFEEIKRRVKVAVLTLDELANLARNAML